MNKLELRAKYKKLRAALSDTEVDQRSLDIANKVLELPIWDKQYYHIFLPIEKQKEVDTQYLLHVLQGKDKHIVVPKINNTDQTLQHLLLTDSTMIKINALGIPEPVDGIEISAEKMEVVFIPLLAFDKEGNRVGYGKGFYDRFLDQCPRETLKIGLSFFSPEERITEVFVSDIPLDYCVTGHHVFMFKKQ